MKVLQLGKFYPLPGGVEKVVFSLTEGLSARGIPCDMLCASADKMPDWQQIVINDCGRVFVAPTRLKAASTTIAPAMIGWLRRHAADYDLVHIHHPDPMAALALRLSGFRGRVILHWHSDILSQKTLLLFYKPLQNWLIRRAEKVVGTTPVYVQQSPHLVRAQSKCTAIPIGIEALHPDPARTAAIRSRFSDKKLILSIGRLVPYKGFPYLIEAMSLLPDDYQLVIGGNGPLKESLQTLIQEKGLQERVTLAGFIPDEDLADWFGACDCFVLSSILKTEAFGIVQIEAMSCGKPVVATQIPQSGVSWVNEDGVSGRNVMPGCPEKYAEAIRQVTAAPARYGQQARIRFERLFSRANMIDKTIRLYENT